MKINIYYIGSYFDTDIEDIWKVKLLVSIKEHAAANIMPVYAYFHAAYHSLSRIWKFDSSQFTLTCVREISRLTRATLNIKINFVFILILLAYIVNATKMQFQCLNVQTTKSFLSLSYSSQTKRIEQTN